MLTRQVLHIIYVNIWGKVMKNLRELLLFISVLAIFGMFMGSVSVSYTHLDVYKRQPWDRTAY